MVFDFGIGFFGGGDYDNRPMELAWGDDFVMTSSFYLQMGRFLGLLPYFTII
jgi:hypothetical protein